MIIEPPHDKTTKWHVHPAKTQISLGICLVWSESSLSAWRKLGSLATHWVNIEDSDQMPRLIWVFAGHTCYFAGFVTRWLNSLGQSFRHLCSLVVICMSTHSRLLLKDSLLHQFFQCPTQTAPEGHITETIFPVFQADCSWRTHYCNNFSSVPCRLLLKDTLLKQFFQYPTQTAPEGYITETIFPVSYGRLLLKNTLLQQFFQCPTQTAPEGHITETIFPVFYGRLLLKNTLLQQFFQCPTADCSWRTHYWNNFFSVPRQTAPEEHITATIFPVSHRRLLLKDT